MDAAVYSMAWELALTRIPGDTNPPPAVPLEAKGQVTPRYGLVLQRAKRAIGLAEKRARCSPRGSSIPALPGRADEVLDVEIGRMQTNLTFFESAKQSYVPADEGQVLNIHEDDYGAPGDLVLKAARALASFADAHALTHQLLGFMQKHLGQPLERRCVSENQKLVEDALANPALTEMQKHHARNWLLHRRSSLIRAIKAWLAFQAALKEHVNERERLGRRWLQALSADELACVAASLESGGAAALRQTCRAFSTAAVLAARMPAPMIRFVLGELPHTTRVRHADGRTFQQHYVHQRRVVRVAVDFATVVQRPEPLPRLRDTDGYWLGPEAVGLRGPTVDASPAHATTHLELRRIMKQQDIRKRWLKAEGSQEVACPRTYKRRRSWTSYFTGPPEMRASLVFADTNEPVPDDVTPCGLQLSNKVRRAGGVFTQPQKLPLLGAAFVPGNEPYDCLPARCELHVPVHNMSKCHSRRQFKIKVRVTGALTAARGGGNVGLDCYSSPFIVVSNGKLDTL